MANVTAINRIAQNIAPRLAPAPGAASTVSNSVGIASSIASAASKSAGVAAGAGGAAAAGGAGGAAGVLGFLSAAAPFLAIGAVAAPIVSNLFSCGTVSQVGCTKRADSTQLADIHLAVVRLAYAVEMGQITPAQGIQQLQQISSQALQSFGNPQKSWVAPSTFYDVCGAWSNNGTPESGPPCDAATQLIPQGSSITGPQFIQSYINWMQSRPTATSSAISSGVISAVNSTVGALNRAAAALTGTNSPTVGAPSGLLLLLGLGVGGYLLSR